MNKPPVSVLLPTYNEAGLAARALESVRWASEILVVDSFSTDGTPELCRQLGARVLQHAYINSAKQKNWAIPQCSCEWVLQVDSDEVLEPGLAEEIQAALAQPGEGCDGYRIPFKHHVLGEWVQVCGLYPEYHLRLFRRDAGRFEDKEVHAHVRVPGRVGTLQRHILHDGMPTISRQLRNLDRYSRYQADELRKRRKTCHWRQLIFRPPAVFLHKYLWQQGFRAGKRGLVLAGLAAASDFFAHAKLWELAELGLEASPK